MNVSTMSTAQRPVTVRIRTSAALLVLLLTAAACGSDPSGSGDPTQPSSPPADGAGAAPASEDGSEAAEQEPTASPAASPAATSAQDVADVNGLTFALVSCVQGGPANVTNGIEVVTIDDGVETDRVTFPLNDDYDIAPSCGGPTASSELSAGAEWLFNTDFSLLAVHTIDSVDCRQPGVLTVDGTFMPASQFGCSTHPSAMFVGDDFLALHGEIYSGAVIGVTPDGFAEQWDGVEPLGQGTDNLADLARGFRWAVADDSVVARTSQNGSFALSESGTYAAELTLSGGVEFFDAVSLEPAGTVEHPSSGCLGTLTWVGDDGAVCPVVGDGFTDSRDIVYFGMDGTVDAWAEADAFGPLLLGGLVVVDEDTLLAVGAGPVGEGGTFDFSEALTEADIEVWRLPRGGQGELVYATAVVANPAGGDQPEYNAGPVLIILSR